MDILDVLYSKELDDKLEYVSKHSVIPKLIPKILSNVNLKTIDQMFSYFDIYDNQEPSIQYDMLLELNYIKSYIFYNLPQRINFKVFSNQDICFLFSHLMKSSFLSEYNKFFYEEVIERGIYLEEILSYPNLKSKFSSMSGLESLMFIQTKEDKFENYLLNTYLENYSTPIALNFDDFSKNYPKIRERLLLLNPYSVKFKLTLPEPFSTLDSYQQNMIHELYQEPIKNLWITSEKQSFKIHLDSNGLQEYMLGNIVYD